MGIFLHFFEKKDAFSLHMSKKSSNFAPAKECAVVFRCPKKEIKE